MKRTFTLLSLIIISTSLFSQTEVQVSTGAGYTNEVYYNFDEGSLKTADRTEWDIAFISSQMSVSILANTGSGLNLYTYPNGTIDDWATVDTTGIEWNPLYNSIETWETGAFNANTDTSDQFDFGWGQYNMTNHFISGDSLYIIEINDTTYKKLAITEKDAMNNQFSFKYADLDGNNEVSETFDADDYATTYIHYSIKNGEFVDHEPESRWQLLFTRYFDYNVPYYVTGILANSGVSIQEVTGVDQSTFEDYDTTLFNDTISQIGWDWKEFNMNTYQYDIADDIVFFVQDTLDGKDTHPIWKIYFTAFGGSTDGVYTFMQENLNEEQTGINVSSEADFSIYPNPANNQLNIIHSFNGEVEISIYSLEGKLILRNSTIESNGLNNQILDIEKLSPGIYSLSIRANNETVNRKFVKK